MTLREAMEKVWNRPGVLYPSHRCWFNGAREHGGYEIVEDMLYVKAGRPAGRRGLKKKGYSFLCKGYGLAVHWEKKVNIDCVCSQPHLRPFWYCPIHGEVTVPMD